MQLINAAVLLAGLATAASAASVAGTYSNYTIYLGGIKFHGGNFDANLYPPEWYHHIYYPSGTPVSYTNNPIEGNHYCDGPCPYNSPYLITQNLTSPLSDVTWQVSPRAIYGVDFFSIKLGCVANVFTKGQGYHITGVPCTITATGQKDTLPTVKQSFTYSAKNVTDYDGDVPHQELETKSFDSKLFHNVTHLSFNATVKAGVKYSFAPSIWIDQPVYGVFVTNFVQGS